MKSEFTIIMYHYVREVAHSRYPNIKGLEATAFKKQISFLKERFTMLSPEDLLDIRYGKTLPKGDCALLTFDDGYIDHYTTVFPMLKENELAAIFSMPGKIIAEQKVLDVNKIHFILASADIALIKARAFELLDYYRGTEFTYPPTMELYEELAVANRFDNKDTIFVKRLLQAKLEERLRNIMTDQLFREFVQIEESAFAAELYMNMDQIKLMKREGMHFGHHGYDHYWLGSLEASDMERDILAGLDVFSNVIEKKDWMMCYPYGNYNQNTLDILQRLNCALGLTSKVDVVDTKRTNWLTLPRLDTNDFPPKSEAFKKFMI